MIDRSKNHPRTSHIYVRGLIIYVRGPIIYVRGPIISAKRTGLFFPFVHAWDHVYKDLTVFT